MKTTANTLRTMVLDNRWTAGRLSQAQIGSGDDYRELTKLYRTALDALTEWAGKDYAHTSTVEDSDTAFNAVKAILGLFTTDENRIIIDQMSMRTLRDCATKPRRLYSEQYSTAMKALRKADKTVKERYNDLLTLGAPKLNEDESLTDWYARIEAEKISTMSHTVDMLELFKTAVAVAGTKKQAIEGIKKAGNYTWKRPVAVSLNEFADLVENYIGDCLEDGYNLKSSATVRREKVAKKAAKNND